MTVSKLAIVILAGGQSRRMGEPKALLDFQGRPLIEHLIENLKSENSEREIWIAGCPEPDLYQKISMPVINDKIEDRGPLEGLLSAMQFFQKNKKEISSILCVPCDGFVFPESFVDKMLFALNTGACDLVYAKDSQREQQLYCLVKCSLLNDLAVYLEKGGRKVMDWFYRHTCETVDFSENNFTFANLNAPDDWEKFDEKFN